MPAEHEVVRQVRAIARRHGEAAALVTTDGCVSYAELLTDMERVAALLRRAGVGSGDALALHAARSQSLPLALLAAWSLGATVALIDSTLPPARISRCEELARPRWRLRLDPVEVQRLDVDGDGPGCQSSHILFTSGTTGVPAGVKVPEAALASGLAWYHEAFATTPLDRVPMVSGLGHDPLLRDVFVPLTCGAAVVVPPAEVFVDPRRLYRFLASSKATILHCTPALLELVLSGGPAAGEGLKSLRLIVSSGAPLTAGLARRAWTATQATVVNAYGATETPQITARAIVADVWTPVIAVPDEVTLGVGWGVAGAELIVDDDTSEIVVRSENLASGYLTGTGRPERFGSDPAGFPGYRTYRTGDRGEPDPHGLGVRITGRIDREMNIDGLRVSPEEIEQAAHAHPAVRHARAVPYRTSVGDFVELGVVLEEGTEVDAATLRAYLREALPLAAVPTRVRFVPRLFTDHNHKYVHDGR